MIPVYSARENAQPMMVTIGDKLCSGAKKVFYPKVLLYSLKFHRKFKKKEGIIFGVTFLRSQHTQIVKVIDHNAEKLCFIAANHASSSDVIVFPE